MAKNVLVVDDSSSVRQVVGIALKSAGYDVIEAVDGKDALSKLTGQKVHLIISDVNMPNMDGITFVKEVMRNTVPETLISSNQIEALGWVIVGVALMCLVIFRPQGLLGDRKELAFHA